MIRIETILTSIPKPGVDRDDLMDDLRGKRVVILSYDLSDEAEIRRLSLTRSVKIVAADGAK